MVKSKRTVRALAVILLSLLLLIGTVTPSPARAESDFPFDQSNVLDDLESSEDFDIINYPYDYAGTYKNPCIMNFVEWCYSPFRSGDFALYIYFYNPQNLKIDVGSMSNRIQIATKYSDEIITKNSIPTDYETFQLIYCNKSERTNYEGLFYKFRIIDHKSADGKTIETRVNSLERRYDVSGVTFAQENGTTKEYTVGGTYRFTGYAEGYGANEFNGNTLQNTGFTPLETIRLEVHPTLFRSASSSLGKYHRNDLNSVYFSVPEKYFTKYGNLQKIKAEWWEYKTNPIAVVSDTAFYHCLSSQIGKHAVDNDLQYALFSDYQRVTGPNGHYDSYGFGYNINGLGVIKEKCDKLCFVFPTYGNKIEEYIVPSTVMSDYIMNYNKSYDTGRLEIKSGTISADLFSAEVDEGRTRGYNVHEFDANDEFDLLSYDATHSGWDRFKQYGFWAPRTDDTYKNISPIDANISKDILNLSENVISETLFINQSDIKEFKAFYNVAAEKNERTVLFRFAQTDFYSKYVTPYDRENNRLCAGGAYIATETVFLDFKVIHLTFQSEGVYTVIPVTQDPVDIINGISPPPKGENAILNWFSKLFKSIGAWGVLILAIIAGALMLWVISKICKGIASAHWVVKIILIILLAGVLTGCVFAGIWVADVIKGLGGLW